MSVYGALLSPAEDWHSSDRADLILLYSYTMTQIAVVTQARGGIPVGREKSTSVNNNMLLN